MAEWPANCHGPASFCWEEKLITWIGKLSGEIQSLEKEPGSVSFTTAK